MMAKAPWAMLCRPDEQKRLIVSAGTELGRPALKAISLTDNTPLGIAGNVKPEALMLT